MTSQFVTPYVRHLLATFCWITTVWKAPRRKQSHRIRQRWSGEMISEAGLQGRWVIAYFRDSTEAKQEEKTIWLEQIIWYNTAFTGCVFFKKMHGQITWVILKYSVKQNKIDFFTLNLLIVFNILMWNGKLQKESYVLSFSNLQHQGILISCSLFRFNELRKTLWESRIRDWLNETLGIWRRDVETGIHNVMSRGIWAKGGVWQVKKVGLLTSN